MKGRGRSAFPTARGHCQSGSSFTNLTTAYFVVVLMVKPVRYVPTKVMEKLFFTMRIADTILFGINRLPAS